MNRESLDALLNRARLHLSGEEYERLLRLSDIVDKHMAQIRLDETRYAEPASIYSAGDRTQQTGEEGSTALDSPDLAEGSP